MVVDPPQRSYHAPCPGCGAPVDFHSAQSAFAVCGYCQSTLVRRGEVLSRLGKMAELFDDHSLLQLGAQGHLQGKNFTLVGRLQYRYSQGTWTEWVVLFDDTSLASLSEDNGAYVLSRPRQIGREVPEAERFRVGATTAIDGQSFTVSSNEPASLISAEGELPRLPKLGVQFAMVELRSSDGRVLSIDYGQVPPALMIGTAVVLDGLQMTGLRDNAAREEKGRQFSCPHCGAPVNVAFSSSKSISCPSCNSLIDLSQGLGAELRHAEQETAVAPLIPLGTVGKFQGLPWQVVGFQHRMGHEPDDSDESFGWNEYLIYNAKRGFSFIVDSTEGWSMVKPTTGAPVLSNNLQSATYLGTRYNLRYSYEAETTYVAGEFYWQVERGQKTFNQDFAKGRDLLSREQTPREITWSSGSMLDSKLVAEAFNLKGDKGMARSMDVAPLSSIGAIGIVPILLMFGIILVFLSVLSRCTACDPQVENCSGSSSRSSGGSWGGYSSGGGHK